MKKKVYSTRIDRGDVILRNYKIALILSQRFKAEDITCKDFCKRLSIDPSNFSRYLNGHNDFTLDRFIKIINKLGGCVVVNFGLDFYEI